MSKLESTKRTNAIFLLIVLVAGTFTAMSPFMTGAQAFQMENNYNSTNETLEWIDMTTSNHMEKTTATINTKIVVMSNVTISM